MLRLIVTFSVIVVATLVAVWLADLGGTVMLTFPDMEVEVPLLAFVVGVLAAGAVLLLLWKLGKAILTAPASTRKAMRMRRRRKARETLVTGLIAAEAGETRKALTMAAKAEKLSNEVGLVRLLEARAALSANKKAEAGEIFKTMLSSDRTRLLGLKGLYDLAWDEHRFEEAEELAKQARSLSQEAAWPVEGLLHFQTQHEDWDAALTSVQALADGKHMERGEARRLRAVLLTAKAQDLATSEEEAAFNAAKEAHALAQDLVPATDILAELAERRGDYRKARKVLEAGFKAFPHPDLFDRYLTLENTPGAQERLKRARKLSALAPEHVEAKLGLAAALIDAAVFDEARQGLLQLLQSTPSVRGYRLMAELEEAEHGDVGRAREWLARAVNAPRDPQWVADGLVSDVWAPYGPRSGRLDAYAWKVPVTSLAPTPVLSADEANALAILANRADVPKPAVIVEAPAPDVKAASTQPKAKDNADIIDVAPETPPEPPVRSPEIAASEPLNENMADLTRQPDDPGFMGDEDDATSHRLF